MKLNLFIISIYLSIFPLFITHGASMPVGFEEHIAADLETVFHPFAHFDLPDAFVPKIVELNSTAGTFYCINHHLPARSESAETHEIVDSGGFVRTTTDGRIEILDTPDRAEHVLKIIKPGEDGRMRIEETRVWPYVVHGQLKIFYSNNKKYGGSGTLVGPYHVLTAGHNIFSPEGEGWATHVEFYPALNVRSTPSGCVQGMGLLSVKGWVNKLDKSYDIGMVILDRPIGQRLGWFGLLSSTDDALRPISSSLNVNVTGYPGDLGTDPYKGLEMWTMGHRMTGFDARKLYYQIDTYEGQSGSGVWAFFKKNYYTLGIHTYGDSQNKRNYATRISKPIFDLLIEWLTGNAFTDTAASVTSDGHTASGAGAGGHSSTPSTASGSTSSSSSSTGSSTLPAGAGGEGTVIDNASMSTYDLAYLGNKFALKRLQEEADRGDIIAQGNMIILSLHGDALKSNKDEEKARFYLTHGLKKIEQEASEGNTYAQGILGWIHISGIRPNLQLGIELLTAAASKNLPMAENYLGMAYYNSIGVPRDINQSLYWLTRAAEHGNSKAQRTLGEIYRHGIPEVPKNPIESEKWLKMAARQGDPMAKLKLAGLYIDLDAQTVTGSTSEFSPHFSEIMSLTKQTAELGIAEGQHAWAMFYEKTEDGGKGCKEAIEFYKKAAEQGHIPSMIRLVEIYENGEGVPVNAAAAIEWRSKIHLQSEV